MELLIIVPDQDIEYALRGLLSRHESLDIRPLIEKQDFEIRRHPQRDAGCRTGAVAFVRPSIKTHQYVLVVFDHEDGRVAGRNRKKQSAAETENDLQQELERNGWQERAAVIVADDDPTEYAKD